MKARLNISGADIAGFARDFSAELPAGVSLEQGAGQELLLDLGGRAARWLVQQGIQRVAERVQARRSERLETLEVPEDAGAPAAPRNPVGGLLVGRMTVEGGILRFGELLIAGLNQQGIADGTYPAYVIPGADSAPLGLHLDFAG